MISPSERRNIAELARRFYSGELSLSALLLAAPDPCSDPEVSELLDLIEHEPKRGGFLGASESQYAAHMAQIEFLIYSLSNSR